VNRNVTTGMIHVSGPPGLCLQSGRRESRCALARERWHTGLTALVADAVAAVRPMFA